jgi:hypothetical protein
LLLSWLLFLWLWSPQQQQNDLGELDLVLDFFGLAHKQIIT